MAGLSTVLERVERENWPFAFAAPAEAYVAGPDVQRETRRPVDGDGGKGIQISVNACSEDGLSHAVPYVRAFLKPRSQCPMRFALRFSCRRYSVVQ